MGSEEEARMAATCSSCGARTYRGEECVCIDGGDAVDYEEALAGAPADIEPDPEPVQLGRPDLAVLARLLAREVCALQAFANRARRTDPREAADAENEADELRPVLVRVRALLGGEA